MISARMVQVLQHVRMSRPRRRHDTQPTARCLRPADFGNCSCAAHGHADSGAVAISRERRGPGVRPAQRHALHRRRLDRGPADALIDKFIELGGGVDGKFVIVPTANGNFDATGQVRVYVESQVIRFWLTRGLKNVKMLHTHDPKIADTVEFAKVLSDATAVWFTGGRHWRIVDSYAGTLTYKEFHKVLERGGVIGGGSAGATIQGDYLVRGDTSSNRIVMTEEPNHQKGFEFLRRSAIDQHIDARNRWDDLIPVIQKYPNLLGVGLSEDTAIVVKGDQFEVMGKSKVAIHDNTRTYQRGEKPYYLLGAGDIYNMKTRQVGKARHRPSTSEPTGMARPRSPSGGVAQESRSAASAPPVNSSRLAAPSSSTVGPGNGSGAVPAPIPTVPRGRMQRRRSGAHWSGCRGCSNVCS